MIRSVATAPGERQQLIAHGLDALQGQQGRGAAAPAGPTDQLFGFRISNRLIEVPGRILPPPAIQYGNGDMSVEQSDTARNMLSGGWNMIRKTFVSPKRLERWVLVSMLDPRDQDKLRRFQEALIRNANLLGMSPHREPPLLVRDINPRGPLSQQLQRIFDVRFGWAFELPMYGN